MRHGARPCGLGARDTLRLEAAMPLYGHELTEEIDPFQAGLELGRQARQGRFSRPGRSPERQAGRQRCVSGSVWNCKASGSPAKAPWSRPDGHEIGMVSSGTFSPTLNKTIAMAYVDGTLGKWARPARSTSAARKRRPGLWRCRFIVNQNKWPLGMQPAYSLTLRA